MDCMMAIWKTVIYTYRSRVKTKKLKSRTFLFLPVSSHLSIRVILNNIPAANFYWVYLNIIPEGVQNLNPHVLDHRLIPSKIHSAQKNTHKVLS